MGRNRNAGLRGGLGISGTGILHNRPMTNKRLEEIRDETRIRVLRHPDPVKRRLHSIRAKRIITAQNIARQAENKGPDLWHVLVYSKTGQKIKGSAMSRHEAFRRNATIRDLGMCWTLGQM